MKQAAKTRVGQCFENHLSYLFKKLDVQYELHKELDEGEVLDFIFPNKITAKKKQNSGIICECQTTLKDRFRLSLGKAQNYPNITKYIFTATGIGLITAKDKSDLTPKKIKEINNKGWVLVVFKELKDLKYSKEVNVISFEEFLSQHYESKKLMW